MKRLRRPALTLTLIAFAILACTLGAPAADPSATETAVAASVMTQLSPTQSPISTLSTPPPDSGGKCGDGLWDDAEQADPGLCPQDRPTDAPAVAQSTPPSSPPSTPLAGDNLHQAERAFLPQVTAVEKWVEISIISQRQNFAPSIVKLYEGGYRIFWNDMLAGGITSATSPDGLTFTADSGLRFASGRQGDLDCIASHPWVIAVAGGYRMYYQGNEDCNPQPNSIPTYRIFSAFSSDGLSFTREGVRVDIGESTGLTQAAHGRVLLLADGRYRMWFSANFTGKNGPADILGATSTDGLTWMFDSAPTLERAHDPTVIRIGDKIYIYTTFLGDNFVILESADGFAFTPVSWVEFYNAAGERIEEFGDADILLNDDGKLLIYGSGKGAPGLGVYVREGSQ